MHTPRLICQIHHIAIDSSQQPRSNHISPLCERTDHQSTRNLEVIETNVLKGRVATPGLSVSMIFILALRCWFAILKRTQNMVRFFHVFSCMKWPEKPLKLTNIGWNCQLLNYGVCTNLAESLHNNPYVCLPLEWVKAMLLSWKVEIRITDLCTYTYVDHVQLKEG